MVKIIVKDLQIIKAFKN